MSYFEDIIKKLGWDDGFQIPVADAENQALEKELAALTLHKVKSKNALDNSVNRLTNLKEHFKFVNQENEQTQKLITAHKQQYDTEGNQFHILKGELSKTVQDIVEVNKRIEFLDERKKIQKNELEKAVIKVDRIKQETGWDIEALKAWEEALKKRDDNNELIKKFSKEDERKFNELEARRQLLQGEYDSKNQTIAKVVCELHSCEMIIERTGKAIKQQINERESLITQWKETVKMLQQRDNDITAIQERILESRRVLEMQQDRLQEENSMLENEKKNNRQLEMDAQSLNAMHSRMRRELADLQQTVFALTNDYHTFKRRVSLTAHTLGKLRLKTKEMDYETDEAERKCTKDRQEAENLEAKIKEMQNNSMSASERIIKVKKMLENEEKRCNIHMSDTEKINNNLYRTDQLLKEQRSVGKVIENQISNTQYICHKLRKHIRDEKRNLEKLKEIVYDMQFKIDEFEQKLCKLEGSNNKEEHADEKDDKIKELEKTLADHLEVQHNLQSQVDRLQDEMRKLSNFIAADKEHLEILQNKVENHLLVYDIGRKHIASARKSCQEKQVEENIMRLRINHIESDMEKEEQKIFNLQKLRLTLDHAMKEHKLEIDTKKTVVMAKRKHLDEEKGRLKGDISLRKVKVEHLQKKYHIELMSLGKDDDGQLLSITHIKIKNAQDKFMLQQEGDELDQKIKIAEKEIVAIENTLKMVNLTNVAFRNNLAPLKEDELEIQEMKALENLLKEKINKTRRVRNELQEQEKAHDEVTKYLNETLISEKNETKEMVKKLEEENCFIEKQKKNYEEKLQRTQQLLRKLLKKLKNKDITVYEQDLEVRQLRDANNNVIKKLYSMRLEFADIAPNINKYSAEQNIDLQSFVSLSSNTFSTTSSIHSKDSSARSVSMDSVAVATKKIDILFK